MNPNPMVGVLLHAMGGLAAASFYLPFRKVRGWSWETYWLVGGFFSWIIVPWVVSLATVPDTVGILANSPPRALGLAFLFGMLWGAGGLTFGLSMRYLGLSLGYALALGNCAAFGTLIPPLFLEAKPMEKFTSPAGIAVLAGVALCLVGIAVCAVAGLHKERELPDAAKRDTVREFNFRKGVWVAILCGILSACMAFGITAGKPISALAVARGSAELWQNGPVFIVIMAGGFVTNFLWCVYLHFSNRTGREYGRAAEGGSLAVNYLFSALAGLVWYLQFMFYGMGTTKLGERFDFSSWTLHMAFIIVFSNLWGFAFREWSATSGRTRAWVYAGVLTLIVSTIVVGYGNYLAEGVR